MPNDPYRPGAKPTPLRQSAVLEPRVRDDEPTLCRCPFCAGGGMVTPEMVILFDAMVKAYEAKK